MTQTAKLCNIWMWDVWAESECVLWLLSCRLVNPFFIMSVRSSSSNLNIAGDISALLCSLCQLIFFSLELSTDWNIFVAVFKRKLWWFNLKRYRVENVCHPLPAHLFFFSLLNSETVLRQGDMSLCRLDGTTVCLLSHVDAVCVVSAELTGWEGGRGEQRAWTPRLTRIYVRLPNVLQGKRGHRTFHFWLARTIATSELCSQWNNGMNIPV